MASAIEYGTLPTNPPSPPPKSRARAVNTMRYGKWMAATPTGFGCPVGFTQNSWGCTKYVGLGDPESRKGAWLGIAGLLLSAGLMVAMGFTRPVSYRRRRT